VKGKNFIKELMRRGFGEILIKKKDDDTLYISCFLLMIFMLKMK